MLLFVMSTVNVENVRDSLKKCMDPEVPLSIVDMGLIYGINVTANNDVNIKMTMTTKGCPLHETMVDDVKRYAKKSAGKFYDCRDRPSKWGTCYYDTRMDM